MPTTTENVKPLEMDQGAKNLHQLVVTARGKGLVECVLPRLRGDDAVNIPEKGSVKMRDTTKLPFSDEVPE